MLQSFNKENKERRRWRVIMSTIEIPMGLFIAFIFFGGIGAIIVLVLLFILFAFLIEWIIGLISFHIEQRENKKTED